MRLAPDEHDMDAFALLRDHLVAHTPWGAKVEVTLDDRGLGFSADAQGPVYDQARAAFSDAWGVEPVDIGVGGSIPFVAAFAEQFPDAAILVTGVEDPDARAHGANESLHLGEFEKVCVAEAVLLARLGALPRWVPCYFDDNPTATKWADVTGDKYVASAANIGAAAPQGVNCSVDDYLGGQCLATLKSRISATGGSYGG